MFVRLPELPLVDVGGDEEGVKGGGVVRPCGAEDRSEVRGRVRMRR